MNADRWERIAEIFWKALSRDPGDRHDFVAAAAADDAMRAEVLAMLAAHGERDGLRIERRLVSEDGAAADGLAPGTRVGAFRILSLVGRGGMGEVYRAERADGAFQQIVAIKLLRPDARSAELARRFEVERTLMARLTHPHIASVLDGGTAPDGRPYLVLRLIEGRPITRAAEDLPLAARLRLFITVADAVQFAHNHLVVHRDLKPANILVGADGEPVLLDFGIAKLLDPESPDITRTGRTPLTPSHAAPEQVRGAPVTTATDVYGLGALLFEMLTGRAVFAGVTARADLERAILEDAPPPASTVATDPAARRQLRGDLDRIVQMALRKEPQRRYASAGELARDIERHLDHRPVLAQPDRWTYRTTRFIRRHRAGVLGAAILLAGIGFVSLRELSQARAIAAERDRAIREQAAGEEALAFLTDLFRQTDPRVVPGGDTLRVGTFLERAEAQAGSLAGQPERQMRVYRLLGNVRASRGNYAIAESLLGLARDLGVKHLGADHLEVIRTERLIGLVADQYRGETAARPILERAVRRLLATQGSSHPDLATAYTELAAAVPEPDSIRSLLDSAIAVRSRTADADSVAIAALLDEQARERGVRGRFAAAVAFDEAALRILAPRQPPDHADVLRVKGNLAVWLSGMAQWDRAIALAEEVLAAARRQTTAGERLALAHERVALLTAQLPGGPALAEPGIREALRIFHATVAPEHILITSSMRNLAIVVSHQGREREGLALMDSAIARNLAAGHRDAAAYLRGQQVPMLIRLGRLDEALRYAAIGAESRPRLPRGSTYLADLTYWLGLANLAVGRVAEAVEHLGQAHEGIVRNYAAGHPRPALAECAFGVALARAGRDDEARLHLAEACPRLDRWGLADPTVVRWGRAERARLRDPSASHS